MKWTNSYIYTLKDKPADAEIPSHQLMVRAGFIRKLAPGIFTYGPLGLRTLRKFEKIVREELDRRGCIELLMPMVHPREVWEESGRWHDMGDELLRFKARGDHEFCLGGTHEEVMTDFIRRDIKSYRHLPVILYQIQTKFRNEIRPRFGLMRGREFIMKDAYSFDVSKEGSEKSYKILAEAYQAIFDRSGLDYRIVHADSGAMGGNKSQEFHVLAESGEDQLFYSEGGKFAANADICPAIDPPSLLSPSDSSSSVPLALEEFSTPELRTIEDLSQATKISPHQLVKTMFFATGQGGDMAPIALLLRGDDEANAIKVKSFLKLAAPPPLLTDTEVHQVTGTLPGSCGPVGLNIPIYLDKGVENMTNYIVGSNKDGFHLKNVNHPRDFSIAGVGDLRMVKEGDTSPAGDGTLRGCRGIEVGHIFYLGTKYSEAMGAHFLNEKGESQPIEMGSYGIGMGRTIQASIEQNHDQDGMIWPLPLAPFHVHLCLLDPGDEEVSTLAHKIYKELWAKGVEVLMDDREERPGIKFKDADLLGMPLRLNMGRRGVNQGHVDMIFRKSKEVISLPLDEIVSRVAKSAATQ